jgi:hypothetical protein
MHDTWAGLCFKLFHAPCMLLAARLRFILNLENCKQCSVLSFQYQNVLEALAIWSESLYGTRSDYMHVRTCVSHRAVACIKTSTSLFRTLPRIIIPSLRRKIRLPKVGNLDYMWFRVLLSKWQQQQQQQACMFVF